MGSITSYCVKVIKDNFKLLTWLQIFVIAIAPNFIFLQLANASTAADEGWSVTKRLVQGATTFYDGAKNVVLNGKNYAATGTAAITPVADQVAKMIVRTGAVIAVDLAIKALIGSVDYVMDPANNQVTYKVSGLPATSCKLDHSDCAPSVKNLWSNASLNAKLHYTPDSACLEIAQSAKLQLTSVVKVNDTNSRCYFLDNNGGTNSYVVSSSINPVYDPAAPKPSDETRSIPYTAVASQVIADANASKADAKAYVSSVADTALEQDEQKQIVPATAVTQQLNNSQAIPTNNTAQGQAVPQTNPNDPTAPKAPPTDITINFPVFCSWAPTVCQAAQSGIDFVKSYLDDSKALKKEYADNPKFDDKPLEFDKDPATPDTTISFGGGCPTPLSAPYSFMGISGAIEIPFTPFCKIAEVSKPVIIAVSAYFAALIIGGIRSGDA
ncbi:virulence factor TspB C-terminal domain-related protein [Acinetobacter oleivorans]